MPLQLDIVEHQAALVNIHRRFPYDERDSPTLTLEATTFNKPQLQEQLSVLEQRQEAQIALAGRSNVGKSSLVNALARRKQLAKISATPGKTRSINFYRVAPDGFSLVDLPGYGYAKCSQEERKSWAKLIEYYLTNTPTLKALALLLDCRIPPQALDRDLADFARGHGIPLLPVLTKADKCTQVERSKRQQEWSRLLNGIMPLPVSSKDFRWVSSSVMPRPTQMHSSRSLEGFRRPANT